MLSLAFIRENPDAVRKALADRHTEAPLDDILGLDGHWRRLLQEVEALRAARNAAGGEMGQLNRAVQEQGKGGQAATEYQQAVALRDNLLAQMQYLSHEIDQRDGVLGEVEERLNAFLLQLPNIPDPKVPLGGGEEDNVVVRTEGEPRAFDFEPRPHWELGERLGIIDF